MVLDFARGERLLAELTGETGGSTCFAVRVWHSSVEAPSIALDIAGVERFLTELIADTEGSTTLAPC